MDKVYVWLQTPMTTRDLRDILEGLDGNWQVGVEDGIIVLFKEEY